MKNKSEMHILVKIKTPFHFVKAEDAQ